jgi:predicted Zn finger-like uncharacterized protein
MGEAYNAECGDCGQAFRVVDGSGIFFGVVRCTKCGRSKAIRREQTRYGELRPFKSRCRCGGQFTETALPRCPKCRSLNLREAADPHRIMFD